MLPDGWLKKPVGKICQSIVPGRNKPRSFSGSIPWVTTPEIHGRYLPSCKQINYVSDNEISESGAKLIPVGSVVIAAVGELGLTAIAKEQIVLNQQLHAFVCSEELSNEYLAYYIETQKPFMESIASKTTIMYMNKTNCESIPILYPPLPEQKKIAKILSTWDQAITTTEQLIANSQQQKKALMQQLLTGKKRLVGFSGEWEKVEIKQFGTISSGGTPSTKIPSYWGGDVLWMTPTDVTALKSRFIKNTKRKITFEGVNNSSATILPSGSLLVCTRATIGLMSISTGEITTNQGFKNIVPNKNYDVNFLYYLFNNSKNELIRYACGSTFLELSKKDFEKIALLVPLLAEQQKIAQVLTSADQEIETLQQKLNFLKKEKKALMQQLLTGKRRVKLIKQEAKNG